jgi:hypothetical protein
MAQLAMLVAPGAARHSSTGTSPGSTMSAPTKNRAACSRSRKVSCCWTVPLQVSCSRRSGLEPEAGGPFFLACADERARSQLH